MAEIENNDLQQQFGSDNYAGICPEAWQAMEAANRGHVTSYGDDPWTAKASDAFRDLFETECEVYFVFNGTAANSLALASLCQSYHSVICSDQAHVETDECGAPEFFSNGSKLLVASSPEGKLTPDAIRELATKRSDIHYPKPRVVSITQSTETGRVYTLAELRAISEECRKRGLSLHMDGARFSNACASLGCSPAEMTWKSGVDVLCFGGAKNGMAMGEAVLFFDRSLATDFDYRCKQAGQLASKMRFLSAPWVGMLESGAWLRNANTPIAARSSLLHRLPEFPACGWRSLSKPTRCSLRRRRRCSTIFARADGASTPSLAARHASCSPGTAIPIAWKRSSATCASAPPDGTAHSFVPRLNPPSLSLSRHVTQNKSGRLP
jgi:threonine aldolase